MSDDRSLAGWARIIERSAAQSRPTPIPPEIAALPWRDCPGCGDRVLGDCFYCDLGGLVACSRCGENVPLSVPLDTKPGDLHHCKSTKGGD
jgi:hypothetical protein